MFRQMRRKGQQLCKEECVQVLNRGTNGVLALAGDDGYPYAVPLSYVYVESEGKLYFHCAKKGHKLDAIMRCDKASFCVVDQDQIMPKAYTTHFRSVIAFGRANIIEEEAQMRSAMSVLAAKYRPGHESERTEAIDKEFPALCLIEFNIEHMTGKEAIELVKAKRQE